MASPWICDECGATTHKGQDLCYYCAKAHDEDAASAREDWEDGCRGEEE